MRKEAPWKLSTLCHYRNESPHLGTANLSSFSPHQCCSQGSPCACFLFGRKGRGTQSWPSCGSGSASWHQLMTEAKFCLCVPMGTHLPTHPHLTAHPFFLPKTTHEVFCTSSPEPETAKIIAPTLGSGPKD